MKIEEGSPLEKLHDDTSPSSMFDNSNSDSYKIIARVKIDENGYAYYYM